MSAKDTYMYLSYFGNTVIKWNITVFYVKLQCNYIYIHLNTRIRGEQIRFLKETKI